MEVDEEVVKRFFDNPRNRTMMVGVVSFVTGSAIGYWLGRRRQVVRYKTPSYSAEEVAAEVEHLKLLREQWEESQAEEVQEVVVRNELGEDALEEWHRRARMAQEIEDDDFPNGRTEVSDKIFAENVEGEWDYQLELQKRSGQAPYVIHKDEFFADELEYAQSTLTYYAGDDILVDEENAPIYNHETVVGPMMFGHGSAGDPNVFYVRNDKRKAEYEILHDPGLFSVEVLGLEIEDNDRAKNIKHNHPSRNRPWKD